MEPFTFREVARLINRIGITRINDAPSREEKGHWALYEGLIQTGTISIPFNVLYVLSDATWEGTREARSIFKRISKGAQSQLVLAPSLRENTRLVEAFREVSPDMMYLNDYFSSFIRQQVNNYLSKVKALQFKDYVDPQIKVAGTFKGTSYNPVVHFLMDPDMTRPIFTGTLGVLLAEPGQGKTFMTRYLASEVAKKGAIPLYVHSEQWSRMQREDISSIWKTIVHSFKHFESPIGWIDGAEEEFIKVSLKAGLFRVIFDGFDEYVLWNRGAVDPLDTIKTLQEVTEQTGARILITARTSFWESEISESPAAENLRPQHIFEIQPFDQTKATTYFSQRFSKEPEKEKAATKLFAYLKQKTANQKMDFVGRGFFLFLIADLVDRGFTMESLQLSNRTVLQWIMEELCERERTRQKIPFSAEEQLKVFEEFSELVLKGEQPNTETLKLVFSSCTSYPDSQVNAVFAGSGSLKDHPLIRLNPCIDEWDFTQDQLRYFLLARRIIEYSDPVRGNQEKLTLLLNQQTFNPQMQTDVATAVADHFFELQASDRSLGKIKEIIKMTLGGNPRNGVDAMQNNPASFATTLALIAINKEYGAGSAHAERTEELVSMFPGNQLSGLCFTGTLARFDFSGVAFKDSVFNQVVWANCTFDGNTKFSKCRFHGGSVLSCKQFGMAEWESNCVFDEDARNLIQAESVRAGKKSYSIEDLRSDINYLLRKFIPKESLGLRTVTERNLTTGVIKASIHCKDVVDSMKKHVIDEHSISGTDATGFHVREEAKEAVIYWATNGVYTGALSNMFEELKKKINPA